MRDLRIHDGLQLIGGDAIKPIARFNMYVLVQKTLPGKIRSVFCLREPTSESCMF